MIIMNKEGKNFDPDWCVPPGVTIADLLEERSWTQVEFALRIGFTPKHVNLLIKGQATINEETALRLERVLGSTISFWLTREVQYREALTRQSESDSLEVDAGWLKELPIRDMISLGWIRQWTRKGQQVAECLRFFGVASVSAWRSKWDKELVAFRLKKKSLNNRGSIAAWICQCEREAHAVNCLPFDESKFKEILKMARKMTEEDLSVFMPKLKEMCASVGVVLTVVPGPKGCGVFGAARWLTSKNALIMLSNYYKSNDQFWFSFFHEAGHLLLHPRRVFFIDVEGQLYSEEEEEANKFASNLLIPPGLEEQLCDVPLNEDSIKRFAKKIDIAPGIVVGRLQKEGLLGWRTNLNGLKRNINISADFS